MYRSFSVINSLELSVCCYWPPSWLTVLMLTYCPCVILIAASFRPWTLEYPILLTCNHVTGRHLVLQLFCGEAICTLGVLLLLAAMLGQPLCWFIVHVSYLKRLQPFLRMWTRESPSPQFAKGFIVCTSKKTFLKPQLLHIIHVVSGYGSVMKTCAFGTILLAGRQSKSQSSWRNHSFEGACSLPLADVVVCSFFFNNWITLHVALIYLTPS